MADNQNNNQANDKAGAAGAANQEAGQGQAAPSGGADNQGRADVKGIDFLLDVPLQVSVEVGRAKMLVKDFLQMKEGGVIELDKLADEPLDLYVNDRLIARGEAVVVNEKFGLRLIDVVSTSERLEKLG